VYQQHQSADEHAAGVDIRGDHAMGFSHETTAHHFTLLPDGGIIAIETKAEHDDVTRDQIRAHMKHIAAMFSASDFDVPMFIHDKVPPGVAMMKQKQGSVIYTFEATEHGAQVRIKTQDPAALKAVHEFLTFQIEDHRTGDIDQVKPPASYY
jgi:hypothetical protein